MPLFRVEWSIDIEAPDAQQAVVEALRIQRNPESIATVFEVESASGDTTIIDLGEDPEAIKTMMEQGR